MRDWNVIGHLVVVPAVLVLIGVMLYDIWHSPNPNQNTWWTEVRKQQQALKVEPIVSPEYREVSTPPSTAQSANRLEHRSNESFSIAIGLPMESTCKEFGGEADCDFLNELPNDHGTSHELNSLVRTVDVYDLPDQRISFPVMRLEQRDQLSIETMSDFERHVRAPAKETVEKRLSIVIDDNWSMANHETDRMKQNLVDSANVIYKHLKRQPRIRLVIRFDEDGPRAVYTGRGKSKQPGFYHEIWLDTNGYQPQVIYQFAHEFGHVIQNYNRFSSKTDYENAWFHEALCEVASIYALYSLDENGELKGYVDDYRQAARERLALITEFKPWILEAERRLRDMAPELDRETQAVVAYRLLPVFEKYPALWDTLWELPTTSRRLSAYLAQWRRRVDATDRYLIDHLERALLGS